MNWPSGRDWLFSLKTFGAATVALYLAFFFALPRPYWAMSSVYIVSSPLLGATRSKALYRAAGTLLGATAAVAFVPPFVQTPLLFSLIASIWTGTLLFLGISDRTARAYVFLLAGYSLPLIALPTIATPERIFDVAVARSEEILLGILCASVFSGSLFPSRIAPVLAENTTGWFRDAAATARAYLMGQPTGKDVSARRQRLAATVNGLEVTLSQLTYDDVSPVVLENARALRGRMAVLLPVSSALVDPILALRGLPQAWSPQLDALIARTGAWIGTWEEGLSGATADELRAELVRLEPPVDSLAQWSPALQSVILWRLRQLIDLWQDCCTLRQTWADPRAPAWQPRFLHWRLGGSTPYFDRGLMVFQAGSAVLAIFFACALWILSGWQYGAGMVSMVAVACSLFASLDEPAPKVFGMFAWTSVSVVIAGVYLFAILPLVHDFPMLILLLAIPFVSAGTLMAQPRFNAAAMTIAINVASFVSLQDAYDADFLTFMNGNIAGPIGLFLAYQWMRVTRPFGAEMSVRRLTVSGWSDVAAAASPAADLHPRELASRMLDRTMQLQPRVAAAEDNQRPSVDSFRELRAGLNALDLRVHLGRMRADGMQLVEDVLEGLHAHFVNCVQARRRVPVPETLLPRIEAAFAYAASPDIARYSRDPVHFLVGLKLSLFPARFVSVIAAASASRST
ncbi:FUSC family protein [Paraburkholderia aromaticivorans]|uniref:FUSC family protein n=1 Tax=Paraburkholderia aromaticivorans TaxID=2026199 RepID=UPI001456238C|nr:FUSC family protein [Paraburkholderia aromaticivorans]